MLKIENLSFSYGKEKVLNDFSLELQDQGIYAVMGPSGCGKSTLFSLICGLIKPHSGKISHDFRRISYAFQEPRLIPHMTAAENVNFVLGGKKSTLYKAKKALESVGLGEDTEKYPSELSGGMQKRVSLARAFAYGGDFLLLDEPFAGLDDETKNEIIQILKEIGKSTLVLMITHEISESEKCADDILLFNQINRIDLIKNAAS